MKSIFTSFLIFMSAVCVMAQVRVATPDTELILNAEPGQELQIVYFGNRLCDTDVANLQAAGAPCHNAYPPYGLWCASESALGKKSRTRSPFRKNSRKGESRADKSSPPNS